MPNVTKSVELPLGQDDAFALATDPNRFGEWLTIHAAWPNGAPSLDSADASFVQKLQIMGMPADVTWTVTEVDAPAKLVMTGEGPMGATLATTITTAPAGDGATTLSYDASFEGGGLQGPMGDIVTKTAGDEISKSLEKLQGLSA